MGSLTFVGVPSALRGSRAQTRDRGPFARRAACCATSSSSSIWSIGVVVANSHHYFTHLNSLTAVLSALLAVVLWPLILFGVSLHIK